MTQPNEGPQLTNDDELETSDAKANDDDNQRTCGTPDDDNQCTCGTPECSPDGECNTTKTIDSEKTACKKSYSQLKKKNSKKKRERRNSKEDEKSCEVATERLPTPRGSWLLRLFESKLFDMAIAIAYLYKSKESGVLAYLGNKLFVSFLF